MKYGIFQSDFFICIFAPRFNCLLFSPVKWKNIVIFISGIIFFCMGEPVYVLLMLFTTVVDYTAGRLMDKYDDRPKLRTVFFADVCYHRSQPVGNTLNTVRS